MTTKIARHASLACAVCLLLIFAVLSFAFSCTRPNQPPPPQSEPITAVQIDTSQSAGEPDSLVIEPGRTILDKIFGRHPSPYPTPRGEGVPARIGKKATINVYYGNVTNAGKKAQVAAGDGAAVVVAAKKSTAVAADSGASVQVATSREGPAAAGEGIEQHQVTQKKTLADYLVPAVGTAAVFGVLYWLLLGGGGTLLLALWRKNKPDNQA